MNLRHIMLIARREYVQKVRNPAFIIGTVLGILGIAALAFVPGLLSTLDQQSTVKVAIVDPKDLVYPYLPTPTPVTTTPTAAPAGSLQSIPSLDAGIAFSKADTEDESVLTQRVNKGEINAYVVVKGDKASQASFVYHGSDRPSATVSSRLLALLSSAAVQARLKESGITPEQAQILFTTPQLKVEPLVNGTLRDEQAYFQSVALVYVLLILLYMTLLLYGIQVATGVVEEKSSRVMEVLITSARPIELMIGKVLGVGAVGLTQYALWVVMGFVGLLVSGTLGTSGTGIDIGAVPAGTLISFLVFFVLGYFLYAALYAALGSLVNRQEEINSITAPITFLTLITYFVSFYALSSPNAELVRWLSFIPFFTPMVMFIRVAIGTLEWWELALSILLLAGSGLLFAWVAAKIYRVGVLMYGKRPSFREIGRMLRTA